MIVSGIRHIVPAGQETLKASSSGDYTITGRHFSQNLKNWTIAGACSLLCNPWEFFWLKVFSTGSEYERPFKVCMKRGIVMVRAVTEDSRVCLEKIFEIQLLSVFLGSEILFYSWQLSFPVTNAWMRRLLYSIFHTIPKLCGSAFLVAQSGTHCKSECSSFFKEEKQDPVEHSPSHHLCREEFPVWPTTGEKSDGPWDVWISFSFPRCPCSLKWGISRVKGFSTQEAHSVLVQQMFSFFPSWKNSTYRESW